MRMFAQDRAFYRRVRGVARSFLREVVGKLSPERLQVDCAPCKHGGSESSWAPSRRSARRWRCP